MLDNGVLLTSDKGLVNFDGAGFYNAVKKNLVAKRKDGNVAFGNGGGIYLDGFVVSQDGGVLFGKELELVDDFFGAKFIDNTNESIGDGDKNKQHVFVTADKSHHSGKNDVDEIKESKSIFRDDAPGRVIVHETIIARGASNGA